MTPPFSFPFQFFSSPLCAQTLSSLFVRLRGLLGVRKGANPLIEFFLAVLFDRFHL